MKRSVYLYLLLSLLLQPIWFSIDSAFAENSCGTSLGSPPAPENADLAAVKDIFVREFKNCYDKGFCEKNVLRLFSVLHNELPHLNPDDFMVILIEPKSGQRKDRVFTGNTPRHRHVLPRGWTSIGWKYHVVLLFKETILDYDYLTVPTPIPFKDYIQKMFFTGVRPSYEVPPKDLAAYFFNVAQWESFVKGDPLDDIPGMDLKDLLSDELRWEDLFAALNDD